MVGYGIASLVASLGARLAAQSLGAARPVLAVLGAVTVGAVLYMAALWPIDGEAARALLEMSGMRRVMTGTRAIFGSD